MDNLNFNDLNSDIKAYLDEISERLYSGHASVMIGAGFSKNAIPNSQTTKNFLDWNQLADIFFEKVHGRKAYESERYLSPLKLAEEVQAAFGRTGLEKLISDNLPDMEYSPSNSHDLLVRLPWNNIFTTNYDTLIERASEKAERRYDIVRNQKDLVYSKNPRVVKLHGSFPSEKPFIITEEDYRIYPSRYALYVNTVQQSLIENSLCLLGFSGDDPNFLHWLGWIRDNLGNDHSPRIYLVGVFNFSTSKRRLLEQRNITIIDFYSYLAKESDQHKIAIKTFLEYLRSKEDEKIRLDWPREEEKIYPESDNENLDEKLLKMASLWQTTRSEYPGWVICPYQNRKTLWRNTERWIYGEHTKQDSKELHLIAFWYELVWRLEKCLMPLTGHLELEIRRIVMVLNPFLKNSDKNSNDLKDKWGYLAFSLLRFYREEGKDKEWSEIYSLIYSIKDLSDETKSSLVFEQCYFYLYKSDVKNLPTSFESLRKVNLRPFEKAKFASILAEFGNVEEAHSLVEESLNSVRSIQNLKPVTNNYQHLSEESYILQIQKMIKDSRSFSEDYGKSRFDYIDEFLKRWNNLKEYKCDPWGELEFFELKLGDEPIEFKTTLIQESFDVGRHTVSHKLGGVDKEQLLSYNFLKFIEDAGIPLRVSQMNLGKNALEGAILRVQASSPNWAFSALIRSGDEKVIERIFDRRTISKMSFQDANNLLESFLIMIVQSKDLIERSDRWREGNIGTRIAHVVPEIISRLICKASDDNRNKVLEFLKDTYRSEKKTNYIGINNLTKRLIEIWPLSEYEILVNVILDCLNPTLEGHPTLTREFQEPLLFIDSGFYKTSGKTIKLNPEKIESLLSRLTFLTNENRNSVFLRLVMLHELNLMTKEQEEQFGKIVWSNVGPDKFPEFGDNIPKSLYLGLPHPQEVNLTEMIKKNLKSLKLPYQIGGSVSLGARYDIFSEFDRMFSSLGKEIEWIENDAIELSDKVLTWYNTDKKFYFETDSTEKFLSRRDEFRNRFYKGMRLLSFAVIPFLSVGKLLEKENELFNFIDELSSHDVSMSILASQILIKLNDRESLLDLIKFELTNNNELISDSAIYGIFLILKAAYSDSSLIKFQSLANLLAEVVFWNKHPQVTFSLEKITDLVKDVREFPLEDFVENLLHGLKRIRLETIPSNSADYASFNNLLATRKEALRFASVVYQYYCEKQLTIPNELIAWKQIMESSDESLDLKKIWI